MHLKRLPGKGVAWKEFIPAFIVVVNSLTWNTFMLSVFSALINSLALSSVQILALFAIEYAAIALSAVLGSIFFPISRRTSLSVWMLVGTLMPILFTTVPNNDMWVNALVSFMFGVSLGAGLPSALSCFVDSTVVENRGFVGGVTFSFVGVSTMFFVIVTVFLGNPIVLPGMILWRLSGLLLFLFTYRDKKTEQKRVVPSYSHMLKQRDFVLYFLPWMMFCLINWIEAPLLQNLFGELYSLIGFIEVIIAGVFALLGGFISDYAGRKRVIMIGFVLLGLDYAILSLSSGMQFSWYAYAVLDGVAWGMLASVFFMTLWGDLGRDNQKEKYYTLGGLPYLVGMFLSELVKPYVGIMPLVTAFSLASFFLFLAVLPLMYAPETLPEKKIKERELKEYVEKAKKIKEKYG